MDEDVRAYQQRIGHMSQQEQEQIASSTDSQTETETETETDAASDRSAFDEVCDTYKKCVLHALPVNN